MTEETCQACSGLAQDESGLPSYILLEFKGHRRAYYPNPLLLRLLPGELAIVEADRGEDAGVVRASIGHAPASCQIMEYRILRPAGIDDAKRIERHRQWEVETLELCEARVASHELHMSLVDAEYRFDETKLTFYFTAEGRIDFRELVRDLAATFHVRIELRQIGARDEMKRDNGFGICGRPLCCVSFLENFLPITTGMAKSQNLLLHPAKLSGRCSRLKCCLAFESDEYPESDANEDAGATFSSEAQIVQMSD